MSEVLDYFKNKAKDYDLVEEQTYWMLSDKLLWENFKETVLDKLPSDFKFLDAGGGTGRWSLKILEEYPNSKGMIVDISPDMLNEARNKMKNKDLIHRIEIIEQNLENLENISDNSFDVCFNFHNVLGFVDNPQKVISELKRVVKVGGYVVSLVPNLYHNIFFNIFVNNIIIFMNIIYYIFLLCFYIIFNKICHLFNSRIFKYISICNIYVIS